ncbi:hypothetical protein MFLAVUS_002079 [Mucor flavus]|uniref:Uncharacterized protein n=1 Tax=Mucor flavus TaxID=439312 RepID=A0ABP9YPA8_9FUNG
MSKLILRDQKVIDIIVTTVIGKYFLILEKGRKECFFNQTYVGPDAISNYIARPTEWSDGSESDVLYAPVVPSSSLPPVLVEIRHTIDQAFIDRLVNYSLHVKKEYKAKPVVLAFGVNRTCNYISAGFGATEHSFLKKLLCKYWAERCLFIDNDTIAEDSKQSPLHPLLAIGVFFCDQNQPLISMEQRDDATIQTLYKISKDQMKKESIENPAVSALLGVCDQTNLQFQKLTDVIKAMSDSLLKKRALSCADDGMIYTSSCKRKYFKENSPCVVSLELPEAQQINETEINHNSSDDILSEVNTRKNDMDYALQFK